MKLGQTAYDGIGVAAERRGSGKTRAEFCRERGIAVTTLHYYLRRVGAKGRQRLVLVRAEEERGSGYTLVLGNGRRIELATYFDEVGLSRLVALLERSSAMFGMKVYVATGATDMRKGFEGLHGLVRDKLGSDPLSGHVSLFANRTRTRLKILCWDGSGLWVCAKRLEKGRFHWPEAKGQASASMRQEELAMLLSGMNLKQTKPRRGWSRKQPAA